MTAQRYQIRRELGSNPAGGRITYLACDRQTSQLVVVKRYRSTQAHAYAAGQRELAALRQLACPQIPRYLDSFPVPHGFCLVQEYKDAPSLAVPRAWSPAEVQQIAAAALDILCELQAAAPPLVHRDVKPDNLLIEWRASGDLTVYLVDFGFAQAETELSVTAGTLGFMALEQLYHRPLSKATDLYGLGMTLLCLLTGLPAARAGELVSATHEPQCSDRLSHLEPVWLDWLERLIQPSPGDRFASARAARDALTALQQAARPKVPLPSAMVPVTRLGPPVAVTLRLPASVASRFPDGQWQIAPHPSDPFGRADDPPWLRLHPGRRPSECLAVVATEHLLPGQRYERPVSFQPTAPDATAYAIALHVDASRASDRTLPRSVWRARTGRHSPRPLSEAEIAQALTRRGQPYWTETDFQRLLKQLGQAGYGWLSPEGVRRQLLVMQQHWDRQRW